MMGVSECLGDCPKCFDFSKPQPFGEEFLSAGVFIKEIKLDVVGTPVFQHAHEYAHISYVARGAVRVWIDGQDSRVFIAPRPIFIQARLKHEFRSLLPDTLVLCIHSVGAEAGPKIHSEYKPVVGLA
jgi:hypothetical protein